MADLSISPPAFDAPMEMGSAVDGIIDCPACHKPIMVPQGTDHFSCPLCNSKLQKKS